MTLFTHETSWPAPSSNHAEPIVWVRRLAVIDELSVNGKLIRDVTLRRGLNVIHTAERERSEERVVGHSVGKTLFLRLIRYCLGESTFCTREVKSAITLKMHQAYVLAEIHVQGKPWVVARPMGLNPPSSSWASPGNDFSVFFGDLDRLPTFSDFVGILENTVKTTFEKMKLPNAGRAGRWLDLLGWLSRDQSCRYRHHNEWRSPETESGTAQLKREDASLLIRMAMDLLDDEERELMAAHATLKKEQAELEDKHRRLVAFLELTEKELTQTLALSDCPKGAMFGPFAEKTADDKIKQMERLAAEIDADGKITKLDEIRVAAAQAVAVGDQEMKRLRGLEAESGIEIKQIEEASTDEYYASFDQQAGWCRLFVKKDDLARKPLKDYLFEKTISPPAGQPVNGAYHELEQWRTDGVGEFLNLAQYDLGYLPLLMFPTRPHTPSEIAELVISATLNIGLWRRLTRAVRGVWVSDAEPSLRAVEPLVDIPVRTQRSTLRVAVPSYKTELASWSHAANGGADLNRSRYRRLVRLVNAIVTCEDRPRYAVFPELSIPRRWIRPVANTLLKEGISLIAGVEYERSGSYVKNEAQLFLRNNALGYPSFFRLTQQKHIPAHDERDHLRSMFGITFPPLPAVGLGKPIYDHGGFRFGVLICSELSNAEHRVAFRGNVDAVFVLCWNQDLESFEAMLDAAALDIHSYQVLVNNRLYGDSRVRAPFKDRWRRDVVRIKGGIEDYVVLAELDVTELRHFQSHAEPPKDGMFKPMPEGFVMNPDRKVVPIAKP
jgi:hypothetical protein